MKKKIIIFLNYFKILVDIFFSIILLPIALILKIYRKIGSHKLIFSKKILDVIGIFPLNDHYYEPLFNSKHIKHSLQNDRYLPGIDLNKEDQLKNLSKLDKYNELIELNLNQQSPNYNFDIKNDFFGQVDAEIYFQLIRYLKPKNILEIGSGHSTLIALEAIKRNKEVDGIETSMTCIEPYENDWLDKVNVNILRETIENTDPKNYLNLKKNDILFIDSSHMIRPQGDVLKIFAEILPNLTKGTIIHIHDIFTPKDYPEKWIIKENKFWNEQYLVEALIANSERYEIYLALNYLKNNSYNKLKKVCPYLKESTDPGSFYLRVK
ncbi:class I SAM-dependent methyltransferase [Pelagibacteraceae bacterium]|nr:class I SAM-dependent methyltransferase [Pelagibacteraceae bacterium]